MAKPMGKYNALKDKIAGVPDPISAKVRAKTATVAGGKFPIPDKAHAESALRLINTAKPPLTAAQKSKVRAKAHSMLGDSK